MAKPANFLRDFFFFLPLVPETETENISSIQLKQITFSDISYFLIICFYKGLDGFKITKIRHFDFLK